MSCIIRCLQPPADAAPTLLQQFLGLRVSQLMGAPYPTGQHALTPHEASTASTACPACPPLQFVLTTDPSVGALTEQLQYIYTTLFLDYVVKNPLYTPGEPFL